VDKHEEYATESSKMPTVKMSKSTRTQQAALSPSPQNPTHCPSRHLLDFIVKLPGAEDLTHYSDHRPRLFEGGNVHAVQEMVKRAGVAKFTPPTSSPTTAPQESIYARDPRFASQLLTRDVPNARYQAEHSDGLPPQTDGPSERTNAIPGASLRLYCGW